MLEIRTALIGVGAVNQNFLQILLQKAARLRTEYGITFRFVLAADSSGIACSNTGIAVEELLAFKQGGGRLVDLPTAIPQLLPEALNHIAYDLLLEASPVNLEHGEPGLSTVRKALTQGKVVVLANKGPLVLAFHELHALATRYQGKLAYSATVCGALPVINIGRRDLVAAEIQEVNGIFNATSNFVLAEMATGRSFAEALGEAQRRGIAEADPTLDVEGWDTANKLVIIANSILNCKVSLGDVTVTGMTNVTTTQLQEALAQGLTIKLIGSAHRCASGYVLSVAPKIVEVNDFLGSCNGWEMGIEFQTDLYGKLYHKIWEDSPLPTAAAMLRDTINLFTQAPHSLHHI